MLETTFTTATGAARLLDALVVPEGQRGHDLGLDVPHELMRLVEGLSGGVEFVMEWAPRPEYGLVRPLVRRTPTGARTFGGPNQVVLHTDVAVQVAGSLARSTFAVGQDEQAAFALRWVPAEQSAPAPTLPADVAGRIRDTAAAWRSWEDAHDIYAGTHRELVRLSARVLKGLTYRPTGAIVAAPTTSLPEAVGGTRKLGLSLRLDP